MVPAAIYHSRYAKEIDHWNHAKHGRCFSNVVLEVVVRKLTTPSAVSLFIIMRLVKSIDAGTESRQELRIDARKGHAYWPFTSTVIV